MKIDRCINVNAYDIEDKKFNYWIGISLGNKYFSKENIRKYIKWSLSNTKEGVLIVIADWIYSINLRVLDKRTEQAALEKAMHLGDIKIAEITEIIATLSPDEANKIKMVRWSDVEKSELHQQRVCILFEEFNKKDTFYNRIIDIVKDNFRNSPKTLNLSDMEKLSEYVLHEMPLFFDGIRLFGLTYNAILYPKIGLIDIFEKDLQEGQKFPELTQKLRIQEPAAIIEAYID